MYNGSMSDLVFHVLQVIREATRRRADARAHYRANRCEAQKRRQNSAKAAMEVDAAPLTAWQVFGQRVITEIEVFDGPQVYNASAVARVHVCMYVCADSITEDCNTIMEPRISSPQCCSVCVCCVCVEVIITCKHWWYYTCLPQGSRSARAHTHTRFFLHRLLSRARQRGSDVAFPLIQRYPSDLRGDNDKPTCSRCL